MHDTGRRRDHGECLTAFVRIRDQRIDLGQDVVGRSNRSGLRPKRSPSSVGALRRVLDTWLGREEHRQEWARRIEHTLQIAEVDPAAGQRFRRLHGSRIPRDVRRMLWTPSGYTDPHELTSAARAAPKWSWR